MRSLTPLEMAVILWMRAVNEADAIPTVEAQGRRGEAEHRLLALAAPLEQAWLELASPDGDQ